MSNLASIGFEVPDYKSFQELAEKVFYEGSSVKTGSGLYVFHRDQSGAELWVQVDKEQSIVGMNPHFQATTSLDLVLTDAFSRKESPLDGAFRAKAGPEEEFEFVFDLPDAHRHGGFQLPENTTVGLVGFTSQLEQVDPSTPFGIEPAKDGKASSAHSILTGQVLDSAFKINGWTGRAYLWMALDLGFGQIDVVSVSRSWRGLVPIGTVLRLEAWLSGRIAEEKASKSYKAFLGRLLRGA